MVELWLGLGFDKNTLNSDNQYLKKSRSGQNGQKGSKKCPRLLDTNK